MICAFFKPAFGCGQFIAEVNELLDTLIWHRTVQKNSQPPLLVHMVGGTVSFLCTQRGDEDRIAFDIENIHHICGQTQLLSRYGHNQCIPFVIVRAPQNGVVILPGKFRQGSICLLGIGKYFLLIHNLPAEIRVAFLLLLWYSNKHVCGVAERLRSQCISIIPRTV